MKTNQETAVSLLNQLIEIAQHEDSTRQKSKVTVGESWWVFHLKQLQGLVGTLQDKPPQFEESSYGAMETKIA